jgi:hypothetical protein
MRREPIGRLFAVDGFFHLKILVFENIPKGASNAGFVVNNENRGMGHKRSVGTLAVAMPPLGPTLAYKIWRSHGQRRRAAVNIPHKRGIIHMASVLAPSFYPPRGIFPIVIPKSPSVMCRLTLCGGGR